MGSNRREVVTRLVGVVGTIAKQYVRDDRILRTKPATNNVFD